jgi:hypothetical protein
MMTSLLIKRKQRSVESNDERPPTNARRRLTTTISNVVATTVTTTSSTTTTRSTSTTLREFQQILQHELVQDFLQESIWIDPYLVAVTYQYLLRVKSTIPWNQKSFCLALTLASIILALSKFYCDNERAHVFVRSQFRCSRITTMLLSVSRYFRTLSLYVFSFCLRFEMRRSIAISKNCA